MALLDILRPPARYRNDYYQHQAERYLLPTLADSWRRACIGSGACLVVGTVSGPTHSTPKMIAVHNSRQFTVELPSGMVPDDLRQQAHRLAAGMGSAMLRVTDRGPLYATITLLPVDPLVEPLPLELHRPGLLIGRDEAGEDVGLDHPRELPHVIVQGQTRSGKSIWLYSLLAQSARYPDVEISGVDPSGITLRPFVGARWIASGLADPDRILEVLAELVAEMDRRLAAMPWDRDILPTDETTPVVLVVLDEYPALLRALDGLKSRDRDPGKATRTLIARLLAEAHKVGYRVVTACQRAEASIVGAAERAQCAGRLSFRVDSADSIKLLHPDAAADYTAEHTSSLPGIALCSWPGRPLTRLRGPYIGGYGEFVRAVTPTGALESPSRHVGGASPAQALPTPQPTHTTAAGLPNLAGSVAPVPPSGADVAGRGRPSPHPGAEVPPAGAAGGRCITDRPWESA